MTRATGARPATDVAHYLGGVVFPAHKQDLMRRAEENGADSDVLAIIDSLADSGFEDLADVTEACEAAEKAASPKTVPRD